MLSIRGTLCVAPLLLVLTFPSLAQPPADPQLLTFDEIVQLYQQEIPPPPLRDKLNKLLTTPFVRNNASDAGRTPLKPSSAGTRKVLRTVQWNIERGLEFDAIRLAFTDPNAFNSLMDEKSSKASASERARIREQIGHIEQADLLVLNEVDWGMNRTLFRNVAAELADAIGMNYAYGVEFVEVDPITMGLDQQVIVQEVEEAYAEPNASRSEMIERVKEIMKPDPQRYRGMHGTAILSRYRLQNVRLIPFQAQGHDWYADEKKTSVAIKAEGKVSAAIFKEQLIRQVRRGGRMMLLADIVDPDLPSGAVTVVATHLEDVTTPAMRRKQLEEILDQVANVEHPVILAGDMNTSTHNGVPVSVTRALKQRFGNGKWWAEEGATEAIRFATPLGWAYNVTLGVVGFARKVDDPTRASIPLMGENPEAKFFSTLEKFRFTDGNNFDFRGDKEHSFNGHTGTLANSNERGKKGFVATNELGKAYGPIGRYKLDWIFVRPAGTARPDEIWEEPPLTPYYGRTLPELNHSIPERISDHNPITVDLTLRTKRPRLNASVSD